MFYAQTSKLYKMRLSLTFIIKYTLYEYREIEESIRVWR